MSLTKGMYSAATAIVVLLCSTFQMAWTAEIGRAQAVEMALKNNFGMSIVRLQADAQRESNTWGNAGRLPSLDVIASVRTFGVIPSEGETYTDETFALTGSVRWVLFQGFAIGASKERLSLLQEQSDNNVDIFVEQTVFNTLLSYDNLLLQRELLAARSEQLKLSKDRLAFVESQHRVGAVSSFETLQAKNSVYSDSAAVIQQQQQVLRAEETLRSVLAMTDNEELQLTSDLSVPEFAIDASTISQASLTNEFVRRQALQVQLQREATTIAASAYYPSVTLNSSFGIDPAQTSFVESSSEPFAYSAGLTFSWNLFNGGQTATATQVSEIRERIEQQSLDSLTLHINRSVSRLEQELALQEGVVSMREGAFTNSGRVLELSDKRFKTGTISILDLRTIQVQHLQASVEYLKALYEANAARLSLLRLTGTLSEITIE